MEFIKDLYNAIDNEDVDTVAKLLNELPKNMDILNETLAPHCEMTALHLAVGLNAIDICKLLLKYGCNPNSLNCTEKSTPLHLAVLYDHKDIIKILISYGGDPLILDGELNSCYDIILKNSELTHLLDHLRAVEKQLVKVEPEPCYNQCHVTPSPIKSTRSLSRTRVEVANTYFSQNPGKDNKNVMYVPTTDESFITCQSEPSRSQTPLSIPRVIHRKLIFDDDEERKPYGDSFPELASRFAHLMTDDESTTTSISTSYSHLMTQDESTATSMTTTTASSYSPSTSPTPTVSDSETCSSYSCSSFYKVKQSIDPSAESTTSGPVYPSIPQIKSPSKQEIEHIKGLVKDLKLPVTPSTIPVLANYLETESNLIKLEQNAIKNASGFTYELTKAIGSIELLHSWGNHKIELIQNLNNTPTQRTSKSFYNYILLDPKIIKRSNFSGSYLKSDIIKNNQKFQQFLKAIFYIGKGCGNRPLQHLVDAKAKLLNIKKLSASEKLCRILEIWKSGQGIIVHSVFHHSAEREANVNEAAMLDAIGIQWSQQQNNLTNVKKGSYVGTPASQWTQKVKNEFGSFLLYKCFCSFVVSDPKVFFPQDV